MSDIAWNDPRFDAAHALQRRAGLIDLHLDSIIQNRLFRYNPLKAHRAGIKAQPFFWHADLPRMLEADYGAAIMGIHYWPWESEGAFKEMNKQIDVLDALAAEDDRILRVQTPDDWERAQVEGKVALSPGVEGAHMLNGQLDRVEHLVRRGVSYLTICHFTVNKAATPSMGRGSNDRDGLTGWGRELVAELNRVGIVIDVAHVNSVGVLDILHETTSPIFCTHTGVKGINDIPRNISDEAIDAIAAGGGAIGVMFAPGFLGNKLIADSNLVVDHIDYLVDRVGVDHVAIGSDYDGWLATIPSDMRDCRDIVRVTAIMLERGYSEDDIVKILKTNAVRVMKDVWARRG